MSRLQLDNAVSAVLSAHRDALRLLEDIEDQRLLTQKEIRLLGYLISSEALISSAWESESPLPDDVFKKDSSKLLWQIKREPRDHFLDDCTVLDCPACGSDESMLYDEPAEPTLGSLRPRIDDPRGKVADVALYLESSPSENRPPRVVRYANLRRASATDPQSRHTGIYQSRVEPRQDSEVPLSHQGALPISRKAISASPSTPSYRPIEFSYLERESDSDEVEWQSSIDPPALVLKTERSSSTDQKTLQGDNDQTCMCTSFERHMLSEKGDLLETDSDAVQALLPQEWQWDVRFETTYASWTCTPLELNIPKHLPLTIAGAPVVLPVEYQWPPTGGVNPPPDPRVSEPIDCRAAIGADIIRDVLTTFEGSVGFYLLISGILQIHILPDFDTSWASSHLPHRFGGLKVSYIERDLEPTIIPAKTTEASVTGRSIQSVSQATSFSNMFRPATSTPKSTSSSCNVQLNDFIEARGKSSGREKYAGRIGLSVRKDNFVYLLMSSHVITAAIMARPWFSRRDHTERLSDDWNKHVDLWAGNKQIGTVERSFDPEAQIYPDGFQHDIVLIRPKDQSSIQGVKSPVDNLSWLNRESWSSLRRGTSGIKLLGSTQATKQDVKTFRCNLCSDVLAVGEGIFLNKAATAGEKSLRQHETSTWEDLVTRAVLYRVHPDFDPPTGYSGIALYADGTRENGTSGPGIVGFQSFVQRSGHVQHFNMEGAPLERRLKEGRVAFYGAFQVPDELRKEYDIV